MNFNSITFPYPVLGCDDDILPAPAQPEIKITQNKHDYIFEIELFYSNKEIEELVKNDYADYVCEVTCDMTRYRRCFISKSTYFTIIIPRKSVAGKINFACTITVKRDIYNYSNYGFHPDYYGHNFNMEPGDILGILGQFHYNVSIKYDSLKAVGSFMEINETDNEFPLTNLDKDKIELKLPTQLYNDFRDNQSVNSRADILHASLVLNSLTYALCNIKSWQNKLWAETIMYRVMIEPELEEFKDLDPDEWKADKLAHILLGKPYERLFNYLKREQNIE